MTAPGANYGQPSPSFGQPAVQASMSPSNPSAPSGPTQIYPSPQPSGIAATQPGATAATAAPSLAYGMQQPQPNAVPGDPRASAAPTAMAPTAMAPSQGPSINPPLALDGFCPVTLTEKQQWVAGDRRWGAIHRGRTYLFSGPDEQRRFFKDPDPLCASRFGQRHHCQPSNRASPVPGQREHGVYFGNRIYLFSSEATLDKFTKNPNQYVNQAMSALRTNSPTGQMLQIGRPVARRMFCRPDTEFSTGPLDTAHARRCTRQPHEGAW